MCVCVCVCVCGGGGGGLSKAFEKSKSMTSTWSLPFFSLFAIPWKRRDLCISPLTSVAPILYIGN